MLQLDLDRNHAHDSGRRLQLREAGLAAGRIAPGLEDARHPGLQELQRVRGVAHPGCGQLLDTVDHAAEASRGQDRPGVHHQVQGAQEQDLQHVQGELIRPVQRPVRSATAFK